MIKKIPNILTIGRIIIVPIFVLTFFLPGFYGDVIPCFLFVLASFTDFLDGLLARLFKEESKLGELLDPIADKIIVATALILLVMDGTIKNLEVVAAIIIRPIVNMFGIFLSIIIREKSYISFLPLFLQHLLQILFHLN